MTVEVRVESADSERLALIERRDYYFKILQRALSAAETAGESGHAAVIGFVLRFSDLYAEAANAVRYPYKGSLKRLLRREKNAIARLSEGGSVLPDVEDVVKDRIVYEKKVARLVAAEKKKIQASVKRASKAAGKKPATKKG